MTRIVWTPAMVEAHLQRAVLIEAATKTGPVGPRGLHAAWPEIALGPAERFADQRDFWETRLILDEGGKPVKALDGETFATHWAKGFKRLPSPSPADITFAEKVTEWFRLLGRQSLVDAVWVAAGAGFAPTEAAQIINRRRKYPKGQRLNRETVRLARDLGLAAIVRGLNAGLDFAGVAHDLEPPADPKAVADAYKVLAQALDVLEPFAAAFIRDTKNTIAGKTATIPMRHLARAAQLQAKILGLLTPPKSD